MYTLHVLIRNLDSDGDLRFRGFRVEQIYQVTECASVR
jgi:hypothetical protein